jgi:uncharacterized protein
MDIIYKPWPWYVAGPLIGLIVPLLLLLDNKRFGISSTLRQICAACVPANIPFLNYDWKKESWNLFFVGGIFIGGYLAGNLFANPEPIALAPAAAETIHSWGIIPSNSLMPERLFSFQSLLTLKGFLLIVVGGFMVGFGTRYAGGCTSGHGIFGLSNLQWPSLVATLLFFTGGIIVSNWMLPYILQ